jgi:protein-S-isoprenylcysteine O-methyltransferase Ste14
LTRWRVGVGLAHWLPVRLLGVLILLAGTAFLVHAFARFVGEGIGTPVTVAVVAFVLGYERPTLTRTFGNEYTTYRRAVPGWWPRLTPWRPEPDPTAPRT